MRVGRGWGCVAIGDQNLLSGRIKDGAIDMIANAEGSSQGAKSFDIDLLYEYDDAALHPSLSPNVFNCRRSSMPDGTFDGTAFVEF